MTDLQKRLSEVFGYTGGKWWVRSLGPHWNNAKLEHLEICYTPDTECICETVYEKQDALLITKAPEMLEKIWLYLEWRDIKKNFFLSLYQEIHGEEISWKELKRKVEG